MDVDFKLLVNSVVGLCCDFLRIWFIYDVMGSCCFYLFLNWRGLFIWIYELVRDKVIIVLDFGVYFYGCMKMVKGYDSIKFVKYLVVID